MRMISGTESTFNTAKPILSPRASHATTVKAKLKAHFDAAATHVSLQLCLQPIHEEGNFAARDHTLKALADA